MKVFVCGSKSTSKLPQEAITILQRLCDEGASFLIGDCYGIDSTVQQLLFSRNYVDVTIYTACNNARNNVGGWPVVKVTPSSRPDYLAHRAKDIAMIDACDCAIAIWNGKSKGTGANIADLKSRGKQVNLFNPAATCI